MLDRVVVQVVLALLGYLERRGVAVARDADPDPERLGRAGDRLREWMRQQDDIRAGGKPDARGAAEPAPRLPSDRRDLDAE